MRRRILHTNPKRQRGSSSHCRLHLAQPSLALRANVRSVVQGVSVIAIVAVSALTTHPAGAAEPRVVRETFSADPGWDGFRNRLAPEKRPLVRQDFGYRATNHAGGSRAGEIGGFVQRSPTAAYYAMPIAPKTLDDPLSASGKLAVRSAEGGSGVLVGWFKAPPPSWRTPNSLGFRIDGNGGKFWMFYEYGTARWRTGGGGAFEGEQYQRTPTPPFPADGQAHQWSLDYDPAAADGRGLITFRIDDRKYEVAVAEGHRDDGTTFDHFGIWNVQIPGDRVELYLDDLVVDGKKFSFDDDPRWQAVGNGAQFAERLIRPFHDFGYSATRHAGGEPGEFGGIVFRDERPAYCGAKTGRLTLDDELTASGKLALLKANSDSGVYIGWFDAATKQANQVPEHAARQKNYLGVLVEGPSRVGHYFRPGYGGRDSSGHNAGETSAARRRWPLVYPDATVHTWTIHYRPQAAGGAGQIEVIFDGHSDTMDLAAGDRATGASLDRFGIFNMQSGGHAVEIYLDDLSYTRR
jgi:hypothetical protein